MPYTYQNKNSIRMRRTRFDLSHHTKTMFNAGDVVPIDLEEVYPGDTFKMNLGSAIRTTSPFIRPVMDNMFIDIYSFFVPMRLIWDDWESFQGANKTSAWVDSQEYSIPQVSGVVATGSIADYLGIPPGDYTSTGSNPQTLNVLPFRAYALIWNEYFRNENVQDPVYIDTSSTDAIDELNSNDWAADNIFGKLAKATKLNDYFTSCLPAPQKGDPVYIKASKGLDLPVLTGLDWSNTLVANNTPLHFADVGTGALYVNPSDQYYGTLALKPSESDVYFRNIGAATSYGDPLSFKNLHTYAAADQVALFNVNELREAFALQKALEKDARGGTRYFEYLYTHWNVISPDARLQRPELLAGIRQSLNIQQVAQTFGDENTPLADVGAYSLSNPTANYEKGFVEHGFVMTVAVVRHHHTYQQGCDRLWFRKNRFDFYDPSFAFIGEQPVYTRELYLAGQAVAKDVFGYNEAWADLRYKASRITGALRSASGSGFDIWTFADNYGVSTPVLGDTFIKETTEYIDRALSIKSTTAPQFIADFYFNMYAIRCLPKYSEPGYIDHI